MLAAMLAILGGAYGGYYYTRSQPSEQSGREAETQGRAKRQAEQDAEKQRRDADAEAKRRAALDAEKRRKDTEEAAKRQALLDAENRRKAEIAKKKTARRPSDPAQREAGAGKS
jgi:hypothetical protein